MPWAITMDPADPFFPDPFAPILPDTLGIAGSVSRQRLRRAEILATTRRLIAEERFDQVTLRRVAEDCDVAVQTIRNSFGRRDELIIAAVNEHTTAIWQDLDRRLPARQALIEFSGVIHRCAVQAPGFLRGTLALAFSRNASMLALQSHAAAYKLRLLQRMAKEETLRPGVRLDMLADQLTRLDTILMYEWAQGGDNAALFAHIAASHELLLQGACC